MFFFFNENKMNLKGNRGEWSELYAFLRLLADGEVRSGDGQLNVIKEKSYPILTVFRDDAPDRLGYQVDKIHNSIRIAGKQTEIVVPQSIFADKSDELLTFIQGITQGTEEYEPIEDFLKEIGVNKVKAKSEDKADIRIIIHDLRTGTKPELGYSIKSRLGGASTLINSCGDGSNFRYTVAGFPSEKVAEFNSLKLFKKKFDLIASAGGSVDFSEVVSPNFSANLSMLDFCMPKLIAECLKIYYSGKANDLVGVCKILTANNPLGLDILNQPLMYEYKLKQFLLAFALGMTPATIWNGKFNANGGYIVVKEDGDVICYHFFDRNDLEDYLFNNSYFDTPSTTRHKFGQINVSDNGEMSIKLNIQVRFK